MDRILNEIGKLRHDMKTGFLQVDNRFEQVSDALKETRSQIGKMATLMDNGLDIIMQYMKEIQEKQESRLQKIEKRLEKGGL